MDISISDEEKLSLSVTKFQEKYSRSVLIDAIESFQWGKGTKQESLEKREELSRTYNSWVNAGADIQHAEAMADSVYQWGFRNRETPKSVTSNLQLFCEFNRCWYLESNKGEMAGSLTNFLNLYRIGIASASKWICFADASRFAIYDSRVSAALRAIKIDGKRVFPTIGRRETKNRKYPSPTHRPPHRMAKDYLLYIDVVREIAKIYNIESPAKVEMGLFMFGDKEENWG